MLEPVEVGSLVFRSLEQASILDYRGEMISQSATGVQQRGRKSVSMIGLDGDGADHFVFKDEGEVKAGFTGLSK